MGNRKKKKIDKRSYWEIGKRRTLTGNYAIGKQEKEKH